MKKFLRINKSRTRANSIRKEIDRLKVQVGKLESQYNKSESFVTKILGQKISISSIIAIISAIIALTFSIKSYIDNLPESNISLLSFNLDPYPSYYWQSSYLFDLSISDNVDLNPIIKREKEQIFSSINHGSLREMYLPVLAILNEGTDLYSITHIEIEFNKDWNYQLFQSTKYLIREFFKEDKNKSFKAVTLDSNSIEKPVLFEPGQRLYLVPNIILTPNNNQASIGEPIKIHLFSNTKKLKTVRLTLKNPSINELQILGSISNSLESMQQIMLGYLEVQEYNHLLNRILEKEKALIQ